MNHLAHRQRKLPALLLDKLISRLVGHTSPIYAVAVRYAWTIPVVALAGFVASLLEGAGISLLVPLLSSLSPDTPSDQPGLLGLLYRIPAIFPADWRLLGVAALIMACILLRGILQAGSEMLVSWIEGRVARDIRTRLARQLLEVGYPFFLRTAQVRLLNIISTDSWRASDAVRASFNMVGTLATIVVFSLLLVLTNWRLFLVTAVGAILIRLAQSLLNRHIGGISEAMRIVNLELARRMIMLPFDMVKLVRLFNQQRLEIARFEAASEQLRRTMMRLTGVTVWAGPLSESLYSVLFLAILLGAHASGMELPVLIAFLLLMYRMQPHFAALSTASVGIAAAAASVREVEWLMAATTETPPPAGDHPFDGLAKAIRFDRVSFDYEGPADGMRAIQAVSFEIPARRWTALTGASGVGKSTIVNLLARLLSPGSGRILADGVDLEDIDPVAWRGSLAIAGQDLELFEGTIAENIAFGARGASRDAIAAAAAVAGVHDLVISMPRGYDTLLGERGLSLSGGQRQRIGLARALVRRPSILVLDEATNALDVDSEAALMARLKATSEGMTVLVISHRASTLAYCDRTIILEEEPGSVVEKPAGARIAPSTVGAG